MKFVEKREPEKRREEIREKIGELRSKVREVTPRQLADFSRCWIIGRINGVRTYSLFNYAVAGFQLQSMGVIPTVFAPFSFWKEKGRFVKKGEKAVYILAPRFRKEQVLKEDGTDPEHELVLSGWLTVPVFDYNQTDGEELDSEEYISGGLVGDYMSGESIVMFNDIVHLAPCDVDTYRFSRNGENGFTDGRTLYILEKEDDREMVSTLVHEWAHFLLHFDEDGAKLNTATKELEAETAAYVVSACLGVNSGKAPLYLRGWDQSLSGYESVRIEKVVSAVEKILTALAFSKAETAA